MEYQKRPEVPSFMKKFFAFLELLHLDACTEREKRNQSIICVAAFPKITQTHSACILLLIGDTERQGACHVKRLTAQHINCTNTVQTVQSTTELYLQ